MTLPQQWATPEDFATLFQYFWHRDFPIDETATGAKRTDWTIHIGVIVRNIADLMGMVTRFESGGRKDAVLRSFEGDEIAVEWEWGGAQGNELEKLKDHRVWSRDKLVDRVLRYAVFITYTDTADMTEAYDYVGRTWQGSRWPLLLILLDVEKSRRFSSGRRFKDIHLSIFDPSGRKDLREVPAFPWKIGASRWCSQAP